MSQQESDDKRVITRNRKAFHNYFVDDEYEAGVRLVGSEVKSLREGRVQLQDAYAKFIDNELYMLDAHISPYRHGTHENHEPRRQRKLLMHRRELNRLERKTAESGVTLIPLSLYFKGGHVKVQLGLCRGKKHFDKRAQLKKREHAREIARETARVNQNRRYTYDKQKGD